MIGCWVAGTEMARHLFENEFQSFLKVVLFFFAMCISWTTLDAQKPGFTSIDCGRAEGNYNDDATGGLSWVNDAGYIFTGNNSDRPFEINSIEYEKFNYKALGDFRYFPEPRNKHCYELPSKPNVSYLIRAMFYYDYSRSDLLILPIDFEFYINGTNSFHVTFSEETTGSDSSPAWLEAIFYSPGSIINICLVRKTGTPFISSLELRMLDDDGIMYSYAYSTKNILLVRKRWDIGSASPIISSRFPEDPFDRLWFSSGVSLYNVHVDPPQGSDANVTNANANYVPAKVMQTAWQNYNHTYFPTSYNVSLLGFEGYVYIAMYFQYQNASNYMNITVNGDEIFKSFEITDKAVMKAYPQVIQAGTILEIDFRSSSSKPGPILNAVEIYEETVADFSIIDPGDGEAIKAFQRCFTDLADYQGDPCNPVPHDWLTCELVYTQFCKAVCTPAWFVSSITFSHLPGNGSGFSLLQEGYSYTFVGSLHYLSELSLTHSYINDATFQFLVSHFDSHMSLTKLDLSYNAIKSIPAAVNWKNTSRLAFLNLSHNALEGELPSFVELEYNFTSIQELNLGYNFLTSLPIQWAHTSNLKVLDLSHNNLTGQISSLDILVKNSFESLQELDISHNNLRGTFKSYQYFSSDSSLLIAYFDQNQIEGILDLSTWHASLLQAVTNKSVYVPQLFSFVGNKITGIIPSAEEFEPTIDTLLGSITRFNLTGVFLGGNPYCKGASTKSQLYLCRSTSKDPYIVPARKKSHKPIIIGAIIGGVFASLIGCAVLATIRRLWKKVSFLEQIQQVLADQKVHPPFFSYNELKLATRNFHMDNKLGQGAYGIVYKGLQADGTTLAVKKLFNSHQVQILNEFLNEVVLITGIKHKNLVQLKGCCVTDKQRILVYEYVGNGNVAEALWDAENCPHGILNWPQRFNICLGVARGLSYLHEELQPCIIHRDIKPANILLDKDLNAKIGDFGLARPLLVGHSRAQSTQIAGTLGYWAPEYVTQGQLTDKADVFSFGTLALEIISGRKCIDYNKPPEEVFLRDWAIKLHRDGMLLELLQPEVRQDCVEDDVIRFINIALICVQPDPKRRASMSQVIIMLLGNMDVTTLLDLSNDKRPNFKTLFPADDYGNHGLKNKSALPACGVITEESEDIPLIDLESSIYLNSSTSSTIANSIQLSSMTGR